MWIAGPFPAGHWHDIQSFLCWLKDEINEDEHVEADERYVGESVCKVPSNEHHPEEALALASRVRR